MMMKSMLLVLLSGCVADYSAIGSARQMHGVGGVGGGGGITF